MGFLTDLATHIKTWVYTKTQVDSLITDKADAVNVYTKTEINNMIGDIETLLADL